MMYLTNSFSINMLTGDSQVTFTKISIGEAQRLLTDTDQFVINVIGHVDTDVVTRNILSQDMGQDIPTILPGERKTVSLVKGDTLIVAQYRGARLPEGATELPPGSLIEFWVVHL